MASTETATPPKRKIKMVPKTETPAKPVKAVKTAKATPTPTDENTDRRRKPRYQGKTTGMGVIEFQNFTLEQNRKQHKTDEELATMWRKEFPMAVKFEERHVRGVRSVYNRGLHNNEKPTVLSHAYDDGGTEIPLRGEKKAAREAAAAVADNGAAKKRGRKQ